MLLLLSALAWAVPTLTLSGTCPGPATLTIDGLTPGASWVLATSPLVGVTTVPGGTCADVEMKLGMPGINVRTRVAPPSGTVRLSANLPPAMCGQYVQVLDEGTCATSWPLDVGNPVCNATAWVGSPADIATITPCRTLPELTLAGPGGTSPSWTILALPNLVHAGAVTNPADSRMAEIHLPALRTVDGLLQIIDDVRTLRQVDLRALTHAGDIVLDAIPIPVALDQLQWVDRYLHFHVLGSVTAPSLHEVRGSLWVEASDSFAAPLLEDVGGSLNVYGDMYDDLQSIELSSLRSVGGNMMIGGYDELAEILLPNLHTLGSPGGPDEVADIVGRALVRVDLGRLTELHALLDITRNPLLSQLDISSLQQINGALTVAYNTRLCPSFGSADWPDFTTVGFGPAGRVEIHDNQSGCHTF